MTIFFIYLYQFLDNYFFLFPFGYLFLNFYLSIFLETDWKLFIFYLSLPARIILTRFISLPQYWKICKNKSVTVYFTTFRSAKGLKIRLTRISNFSKTLWFCNSLSCLQSSKFIILIRSKIKRRWTLLIARKTRKNHHFGFRTIKSWE